MRSTVLLLLTSIFCSSLISQTIKMPSVPANGVDYTFDQIEDNSEPTSFKDEGPWDFSKVTTPTTYEMKLLPISQSKSASEYPNATHFLQSQNGEFFYAYKGNEILNYGRITDNTESSYSEPVLWMEFPLTSSSQFTDETKSDFKFNGFSGEVVDKSVSQVLGLSSLVLPNGTKYDNAILVKTIKTMDGQVGPLTSTIKEEGKYWWVPGIALPVVAFEKFYLNDNIQYERSSFLKEEKVLSVHSLDMDFISIYPNPAQNQITVSSNIKMDSYRIFNALGKIVMKGDLTNTTINIESLKSGSYFIALSDKDSNQTYHKRFVK